MVGENSGIWTRLEWINEFNVPMFNIGTALHPAGAKKYAFSKCTPPFKGLLSYKSNTNGLNDNFRLPFLPNDVEPEFGPIYRPMAISRNAKRSIEAVRHKQSKFDI